MSNKSIRIGVIGCGRVAQHYKKILDSGVVSGWRIVGACDIVPERSKEFAEHFDSKSYSSFECLITEAEPDLILILTPSGLHYEHSKIALKYDCNVLVEKPIAMFADQALQLESIAKSKNLMYGVAFQNRLNPAIIALEKAIKENRFGKIITATIRLRWCRYQDYYEDGWHGTWEQDGGVINQQAIHHVDAINWLLGPVNSVNATITNRLNSLEAEDTLVALMRFENGALGTIEATTAARPEDYEASLSVVGEKGMVLIGGIALNKIETWEFIDSIESDKFVQEKHSQEVETGYGLSHGPLLQDVINVLHNRSTNLSISAESAINTTKFIHALYCSDELSKWVNLKDNPISSRLGKTRGKI
jgi:UDP-N-acetyl-2-amino-2-deoxyglucuronate dehydrogenase